MDQRLISIYVSAGVRRYEEPKRGYYRCLIVDELTQKSRSISDNNTEIGVTPNRMTILALIAAVRLLKKPCDISVNTYIELGIETYLKSGKGLYGDLKTELNDAVLAGMHKIKYQKIDKEIVDRHIRSHF